jgi:hypothetical protein
MTILAALAVWQARVATRHEQVRKTQQSIAELQLNVAISCYLSLQALD